MSAAYFISEQERIEALRWYFVGSDKLLEENVDIVEELFSNAFKSYKHQVTDISSQLMKQNSKKIFNSSSYQVTINQMSFSRAIDNREEA